MKHLKYFRINEGHTHENDVDIIIDSMRDFLDDDREILFKSCIDNMKYQDYIDKNSNYVNFKPIINTGNLIRSQFVIVFQDIRDYQDFVNITSQMQSTISRLSDEDWSMSDMNLKTLSIDHNIKYASLSYYFSRPDQKTLNDFEYPGRDEIQKIFSKYGLLITHFDYDKESNSSGSLIVYFGSQAYAGELPKGIEDCFKQITILHGFDSYEYEAHKPTLVIFNYLLN